MKYSEIFTTGSLVEVSRGGLPISSRKTLPVELLSPSMGELSVCSPQHHNNSNSDSDSNKNGNISSNSNSNT